MRSFTAIVASLLLASASAAPSVEIRQAAAAPKLYGCIFNGNGADHTLVTVGHSIDITSDSGETLKLDCGTTSGGPITGVYAKCTVNGKAPAHITEVDDHTIYCPVV